MISRTIGDATLYLGDCREVLPTLERVDAVITSPPYDQMRDYNKGDAPDCYEIIRLCSERLSRGGVMMWNVKDQTIDGDETGTSFRHALHAKACGLRLHDTMIYARECVTFPDSNRYFPSFEYMFVFSKGAPKHFFGIKDRPNKTAGTVVNGTDRQTDGRTTRKRNSGTPVPAFGLRHNWWVMHNAAAGSGAFGNHPAPMPPAMADGHIRTWTAPTETVLDPFMGSGTTGVACAQLGRRFIGIELDPHYFAIACRRIEEAQAAQSETKAAA